MNTLAPLLVLLPPAAVGAAPANGVLGWEAADLPLLLILPVLLSCSGFFSGSETALFGLSEAERMSMRRGGSRVGRAVDALLGAPHMLLITILLANTVLNVLYFVTTSVLLMRTDAGTLTQGALALAFLLLIVLAGEVLPKSLAQSNRIRFVALCSPPLLAFHRAIAPVRMVLGPGVIAPLSRLTAPASPPVPLDDAELQRYVEVSRDRGIIDADEQHILRQVLAMRRLRVRDVMTPRVRMLAVSTGADRAEIERIVKERALTTIPVYRENLDRIEGMLRVKRFLLADGPVNVTDPSVLDPPHFVPAVATLDQLLDDFRAQRLRSAIVVDEFGGTAGVVSVEDVVEEFVGDLTHDDDDAFPPRLVGLGRWTIDGAMSVRAWTEAFGVEYDDPRVATVGGLIAESLGRAPEVDDEVLIHPFRLIVEHVVGRRVERVTVEDLSDDTSDEVRP